MKSHATGMLVLTKADPKFYINFETINDHNLYFSIEKKIKYGNPKSNLRIAFVKTNKN